MKLIVLGSLDSKCLRVGACWHSFIRFVLFSMSQGPKEIYCGAASTPYFHLGTLSLCESPVAPDHFLCLSSIFPLWCSPILVSASLVRSCNSGSVLPGH